MRWQGGRESDNVEDDRGGGGGGGFGLGGRSIGVGSIVIALVGGWIFGINPLTILGLMENVQPPAQVQHQGPARQPPANDQMARFVKVVLGSTEDVWTAKFRQRNMTYQAPKLVLFSGTEPTGCGTGQAAMGPFYCPADQKVYIDLSFYDELKTKFGAPGEFAEAYVIAHEVGHHVQNLLGITQKTQQMEAGMSREQRNAVSVKVELQADCLAGVWARLSDQANHWLDPGDIDSALNAAAQIGDDTLQRKSRGTVQPDSFTHGSSAQRVEWFKRGAESGLVDRCDTFKPGAV